jgi:hypothetical protein
MTDANVPNAVALHALTRDGSVPAARFRWDRQAGVTLEMLNERWGEVTRQLVCCETDCICFATRSAQWTMLAVAGDQSTKTRTLDT